MFLLDIIDILTSCSTDIATYITVCVVILSGFIFLALFLRFILRQQWEIALVPVVLGVFFISFFVGDKILSERNARAEQAECLANCEKDGTECFCARGCASFN